MPIIASEGERKEYKLVPAGTHQAVCFGVWDIGLQKSTYNGKESLKRKVIVGWEIDETMDSGPSVGKRMTIYKTYTLLLAPKAALRKDLEGWRGRAFTPEELKGFDIEKLIGANCTLSVIHEEDNGKTYANISSVGKLMKNSVPMIPENKPDMPEWVKKKAEMAVKEEPHIPEDAPEEVVVEDTETVPF